MNTASARHDLLENCKESHEYREAFAQEHVYTTLAFQIRALREQREWSQKQFGREAKMAQERISILEDPNAETKPTLNTLLRLAAAFDIALDVRFVPFSKILDDSFKGDPQSLKVPSFGDEKNGDEYLPQVVEQRTAQTGKIWKLMNTATGLSKEYTVPQGKALSRETLATETTVGIRADQFVQEAIAATKSFDLHENIEAPIARKPLVRDGGEKLPTEEYFETPGGAHAR